MKVTGVNPYQQQLKRIETIEEQQRKQAEQNPRPEITSDEIEAYENKHRKGD
jgi:antitoxin component HigA of HigAB toxin-antitoxin module